MSVVKKNNPKTLKLMKITEHLHFVISAVNISDPFTLNIHVTLRYESGPNHY